MSASKKGGDFSKFKQYQETLVAGLTTAFQDAIARGQIKIGGGSFLSSGKAVEAKKAA